MTYREITTADLWVDGTILDGDLLRYGPALTYAATSKLYVVAPWERDAARRVLGKGKRCGVCQGHGYITDVAGNESCAACSDGWLRAPVDLGPVIDAEIKGGLHPDAAAGIVWVSVLRVAAGLTVVPELITPRQAALEWCLPVADDGHLYEALRSGVAQGHALAAGYALLNDGAILLPHPDGPVRLMLGDAAGPRDDHHQAAAAAEERDDG